MTDMVPLRMQPVPEALNYVAKRLREDCDPLWAANALEVAARQYAGGRWPLSLLGKRVEVTLQDEPGNKVVTAGRLLAYGTDGEFEIEDATGAIHYCWPLLKIREVPGGQ